MPKKGYTVITVKKNLYEKLAEIARKEGRSIPSLIQKMLEELYGVKT